MTSYIYYSAWLIATLLLAVPLARLSAALAVWLERRYGFDVPQVGWRKRLVKATLLVVAMALARCQFGGLYIFTDPTGAVWEFDGHGWPLMQPLTISQAMALDHPARIAIYWSALAADVLVCIILLVATRHVLDRWSSVGESGGSWREVAKQEAPGWLASLVVVLLAERWLARPVILPGTDMIVYTTLIYEAWYVHAGVVVGLASFVYVMGMGARRGLKSLWRLREEGVL